MNKNIKSSVTVILAYYNGSKYIEEQIDSIAAQENVATNIVVFDDGSSNDEIKYVRTISNKYPNVTVIDSDRNYGPKLSFFAALRDVPKADFYAFSDQDDVWLKDKLARAVSMIGEFSDMPALYCANTLVVNANLNDPHPQYIKNPLQNITTKSLLSMSATMGMTHVFNGKMRDLISKIDINDMPILFHDHWMVLLASLFGVVQYDCRPCVLYRQHGANQIADTSNDMKFIDKLKSKARFFTDPDRYGEYPLSYASDQLIRWYGNDIDNAIKSGKVDPDFRRYLLMSSECRESAAKRLAFAFRAHRDDLVGTAVLKFRVLSNRY
ncbi:glycosyltransferase [Olsenella uli]|uniref:glycosyltransferase n=1 Tax=Olsenella uli TaxID=133926 RepID=UPI0019579511|nr:glycosyltransferase [Olsenella uli]MBM6676087.1 glycosyltransferase [Olsenella uli]